jgi:ATP-dependent Lhr-like helicase
MLPLSFDLSLEIGRFRKLLNEKFCLSKSKKEIINFINDYVYVDKNAAESIYNYFFEQFNYAEIPSNSRIIVEHYTNEQGIKHTIFHSLYGRRVNDCLSRAVAFAISRTQHRDVEIGINDNGFYIASEKPVNVMHALKMIKSKDFRKILNMAIDRTEVLKRRFRHCAMRALMILRTYKGHTKRVGRQQVSSQILINAVKRISPDFSILKEARREVLEDLMDIENAKKVIDGIEKKNIKIDEITTTIPSPFAFNLIAQGISDILKIEDRVEFLRRMHKNVLAKIGSKKGINKEEFEFNYTDMWKKAEEKLTANRDEEKEKLKLQAWNLKRVPVFAKREIVEILDGKKEIRQDFIDAVHKYKKEIKKTWPKEIKEFVFQKVFDK